jgi:mannose-6-phosphate isomerase-like protein (cupin superfamily)
MFNMYRIKYPCPLSVNPMPYSPNLLQNNPGCFQQFPGQYVPNAHGPGHGKLMAGHSYPMVYSTPIVLKDYGPEPFAVNIEEAAKQNNAYRTVLWTGSHLQLALMCINVGGDIGLEMHPDVDQFIRIEEGNGLIVMGDSKDSLNFRKNVYDNYAIFVPAGKWHNLINTGNKPIKLYTIYAPPQHPHGTVHETKAIAQAQEKEHRLPAE